MDEKGIESMANKDNVVMSRKCSLETCKMDSKCGKKE